jgi:hypothetical protein
MIQRIQSLYLLLTTLLSLLFLKSGFLTFINKSGTLMKLSLLGITSSIGGNNFELVEKTSPLLIYILVIPVISLITLLIYKKRAIQSRLALFLIFFTSGLIVLILYYAYYVNTKYGAEIIIRFTMVIPLLILIFSIFAYKGIRKDDDLVKSYDRLR